LTKQDDEIKSLKEIFDIIYYMTFGEEDEVSRRIQNVFRDKFGIGTAWTPKE